MVGGVDLERGEVCGDAAPGVEGEEVGCDGDGQSSALFGISGGAQFVEQNERVGGGFARDAVEVDDVGGEAGEIALDGLGVADIGVDACEEWKLRLFCRNRNAGLSHEGQAGREFLARRSCHRCWGR